MSVYRLISAEKARFPVSVQCELLGVSRSGYYGWERKPPSARALADAELTELIRTIHKRFRGVYGAPRIHAELRMAHGIRIGRKRVERLMREAGISGLIKRKRGRTTIRVQGVRVADDLVRRNFQPAAANVLWLADITYLRSWEGWLYLGAVQDAFSRAIVGWSMAEHMRAQLVVDALEMGISRRRPEAGLVHHSDQGSQPGLNRCSQQWFRRRPYPAKVISLPSRRLARRAGRSGGSLARRPSPGQCAPTPSPPDARPVPRRGSSSRGSCGGGCSGCGRPRRGRPGRAE